MFVQDYHTSAQAEGRRSFVVYSDDEELHDLQRALDTAITAVVREYGAQAVKSKDYRVLQSLALGLDGQFGPPPKHHHAHADELSFRQGGGW
jgi:hypothetical protein